MLSVRGSELDNGCGFHSKTPTQNLLECSLLIWSLLHLKLIFYRIYPRYAEYAQIKILKIYPKIGEGVFIWVLHINKVLPFQGLYLTTAPHATIFPGSFFFYGNPKIQIQMQIQIQLQIWQKTRLVFDNHSSSLCLRYKYKKRPVFVSCSLFCVTLFLAPIPKVGRLLI